MKTILQWKLKKRCIQRSNVKGINRCICHIIISTMKVEVKTIVLTLKILYQEMYS